MKSIELFAGIGGLALGISRAGFSHHLMLEFNDKACQTWRNNQEHQFGTRLLMDLVITILEKEDINKDDRFGISFTPVENGLRN